ncbi:MAG: NusG domain II-containing protein [Thermotogota bacterium]|nr:NusG domain II-containing protein [Thermotogota bacterium]
MRQFKPRFKENSCALFQKRDLYLYMILIFFIFTAVYLGIAFSKGSIVEVRINGIVQYRFSLEEEGQKSIESNGKRLMDLLIDQGDVRIINSQCPLHLCERGTLKQSGVLVCVPQKVIINIANDEEPVKEQDGIDLITG